MALVAHQPQGSHVRLSSRHLSWSKRLKLKQSLAQHCMVGRTDGHYLLKQNICLSVGNPCIYRWKLKPLRISAFKGSGRNNESGSRANGLKDSKNSVRLEESGEAKSESPKAHNAPLSYASEENDSLAISPTIHKLFRKWLTMLRTQPPNQVKEEILEEIPSGVLSETLEGKTEKKGRVEVLKVALSHFQALDVTIKIPLLIFIPFYLAVNVMYGSEVSKELTPLWVLGPLIVALYIKIVQGLCALYVFSFKQTVKVIMNSPAFCIAAYKYVAHGKLKEDILTRFFHSVLGIKDADHKELAGRKLKELEEWIVEKYLDFLELIWPYYCRTIRFLKRANLI